MPAIPGRPDLRERRAQARGRAPSASPGRGRWAGDPAGGRQRHRASRRQPRPIRAGPRDGLDRTGSAEASAPGAVIGPGCGGCPHCHHWRSRGGDSGNPRGSWLSPPSPPVPTDFDVCPAIAGALGHGGQILELATNSVVTVGTVGTLSPNPCGDWLSPPAALSPPLASVVGTGGDSSRILASALRAARAHASPPARKLLLTQ